MKETMKIRSEIEGVNGPEEFNPEHQYGAYAALGVNPRHYKDDYSRAILGGACLITELPFSGSCCFYVQKLLEYHMQSFIPEEYHERIKWITKKPVYNGIESCGIGTIGWKYTP